MPGYLRLAEGYGLLMTVSPTRGAGVAEVAGWSSHRSGLQQQQLIKVLLTAVAVKNDL